MSDKPVKKGLDEKTEECIKKNLMETFIFLLMAYVHSFENTFKIDGHGAFKASVVEQQLVLTFVENFGSIIETILGYKLPIPVFKKTGKEKVKEVHENKKMITEVYSLAYAVYLKINMMLKK